MKKVGRSSIKFGLAAAVMGMVAYWLIHIPGFYAGPLSQRAGALFLTILISSATYFACTFLFRAHEIEEVWRIYYP
jgi:peptidoglycan biosynthesis protein MviN/MurJ (putative lipid II flippase)